jgi:hypothetical protein
MDQTDILRTARLMIEQHGVAAESQARLEADKAFLGGNTELEQIWKQVVAAITDLRTETS